MADLSSCNETHLLAWKGSVKGLFMGDIEYHLSYLIHSMQIYVVVSYINNMAKQNRYIRPNPERAALLTIDMQNDFSLQGGSSTVRGTSNILEQIGRLADTFRQHSVPIIHAVRLYKSDGTNVDLCRREMIENGADIVKPGTDGAELVDALKPSSDVNINAQRLLNNEIQSIDEKEWIMYKPRWSAFYRTPLDDYLEKLDLNTVIVCGCNFPNCPRTTIYDASQRDYRIGFVTDATSKTYDRGLEELRDIGVSVMETEEVLNWIESRE